MRRVVGGKTYDTRKAERLAYYKADVLRTDFTWFEEALYRRVRAKDFFLAGRGAPCSPWAEPCGWGYRSGAGIRPVTPDQVVRWCLWRGVKLDFKALGLEELYERLKGNTAVTVDDIYDEECIAYVS